jgi:hypothetical protein
LFPLDETGLGAVIAAGRRAARRFAGLVRTATSLRLYQDPELDIVTYFPMQRSAELADIDSLSQALFDEAMVLPDPVYLSVARVGSASMLRRHPIAGARAESIRILRSVLMKPEHEDAVDGLVRRLDATAARLAHDLQ